jgi:hypothetical protein
MFCERRFDCFAIRQSLYDSIAKHRHLLVPAARRRYISVL